MLSANAYGDTKEISILDLSNGVIGELVSYELEKVLRNIMDLNTDGKSKRSLKITLEFLPSNDRQATAVNVKVDSKLAAINPFGTTLILSGDSESPTVIEYTKEVPGQTDLEGAEASPVNVVKMQNTRRA